MPQEPVITHLDQLTPVRLTALLRRQGHLDIGSVSHVHVINERISPVSISYRLRVAYTPDATGKALPPKLFIRLANPEFSRNSDESTIFYTQLIPIMRAKWSHTWPFADCIDAAWSPALQLDHLLLEDLGDTHFLGENNLPLNYQACAQLIDVYAVFHAFWWEHPALGKTVGTFLTDQSIAGFEADFQVKLAQLAKSYQPDLSDQEFALVKQCMTAWPQRRRARAVRGEGVTLVHRDPHPGNIFYPHNPATHGIKLIDWQSWRIDAGTDDIAYLIAFHWPAEVRTELEKPLLRRYHQQIVALGVQNYTWDDCVYDYQASIIRFITVMGLHWRLAVNRKRMKLGLQAFVDWQCGELL